MNTRKLLLLAALSLFAGAIVGALTQNVALWIGATFLTFVVLMAVNPWMSRVFSRRDAGLEAEAKTVANELSRSRTAQGYNPDLDGSKIAPTMTEDETVELYTRSFDITNEKARSLYRSGYKRWGDLQEAIPQDLIMVQGINPTVAKRIINTVKVKRD